MKRRYTVAGAVAGAALAGVLVAVSGTVPAFSAEPSGSHHAQSTHHAGQPATTSSATSSATSSGVSSAVPEPAEDTPEGAGTSTGTTADTPDPSAPTATVSDPNDHDMPGMRAQPAYGPNLDPGESDTLSPAVQGIAPDKDFNPGPDVSTHHEFQANCYMSHHQADDPIVYPGMAGASHMHTFMGSDDTNAKSTTGSLKSGATSCITPGDKSGYWHPSIYDGDQLVTNRYKQTIYYKSGVSDYRTVRAFPQGLRYVVGSPTQTQQEFRDHPGTVEGWECGDSANNFQIPDHCREGSYLNIRMQAPSCWDGVHLDSVDHKSHMAYPVVQGYRKVCPADHPVAVPMVEFKMAFDVSGDMSDVHLSSGTDWSWHYDFFNGWDDATLKALVKHCINGGLQCDPRGYDLYKPERGAALNENYELAG